MALLVVLFASMWLGAQTNEEAFREFQFNFSPPGARANGMGSAFIGLADDASATYANPAGLAYLRDPALTLEYAYTSFQEISGSGSGPINYGYSQEPVTFEDISFFSFNFRIREWYFALFGHNYLEEEQARSFSARSLAGGLEQITTLNVKLGLSGRTFGLGIARRFGPVKLGVTLNENDLTIDSFSHKQELALFPTFNVRSFTSEIHEETDSYGWSFGALWEITPKWSLGTVVKQNPIFDLIESTVEVTAGQPISSDVVPVKFVVPDVYGAGLSFTPKPGLHILLDWQHILYRQIIEDGFTIVENQGVDRIENYFTENVDELHLGAEYLHPVKTSILAIRVGYYRNPNHFIRYEGSDPIQRSLFSQNRGGEENHLTAGFGWSFKNRFEMDLALDLWGEHYTVQASVLWRKK